MDESEDDRIQSRLDQGESSEDDDADGGTVFTLHTSEDLPTPMDESVHNVCQIHEHTFQCGQLLRGLGQSIPERIVAFVAHDKECIVTVVQGGAKNKRPQLVFLNLDAVVSRGVVKNSIDQAEVKMLQRQLDSATCKKILAGYKHMKRSPPIKSQSETHTSSEKSQIERLEKKKSRSKSPHHMTSPRPSRSHSRSGSVDRDRGRGPACMARDNMGQEQRRSSSRGHRSRTSKS
jgi:hypothetical protein